MGKHYIIFHYISLLFIMLCYIILYRIILYHNILVCVRVYYIHIPYLVCYTNVYFTQCSLRNSLYYLRPWNLKSRQSRIPKLYSSQ